MSGLLTAINHLPQEKQKKSAVQISEDYARNVQWACPLCDEELTYVKEGSDGTIPHFRHESAADHQSLSEGSTHNLAKSVIANKIERDNKFEDIELEHVVDEGENLQVADIFVTREEECPIAIEIQCSSIGPERFEERTKKYNEKGIAVLWILNAANFLPCKQSQDGEHFANSRKESILWMQRHYYGRAYVFHPETFLVTPVRLNKLKVTKVEEGFDEELAGLPGEDPHYTYTKDYWYDTMAEVSTGTLEDHGIFTTDSNNLEIARFYDSCWWKGDNQ